MEFVHFRWISKHTVFKCSYLNILMYKVWWNAHLKFLNIVTLYVHILLITYSSKFIIIFRETNFGLVYDLCFTLLYVLFPSSYIHWVFFANLVLISFWIKLYLYPTSFDIFCSLLVLSWTMTYLEMYCFISKYLHVL